MSVSTAQMEIIDLNIEAQNLDETEIFVWLDQMGVPLEVNTRLKDLWKTTKRIGDQVISFGKIIILKIVEFIKTNPHAAIGMLLGAAVGSLVALIPWIGPLLAPLTATIGAAYGFIQGVRLDNPDAATSFEGLILLAKEFFRQVAEIFMTLKAKFTD